METTLVFWDFFWIAVIASIFGGGASYLVNPKKTELPLPPLPTDISDALKAEPTIPYSIQIHNDDYTPMDHVIEVLENYCAVSKNDSVNTMLEVHNKNISTLPLTIEEQTAVRLVDFIHKASRQRGLPLQCSTIKV